MTHYLTQIQKQCAVCATVKMDFRHFMGVTKEPTVVDLLLNPETDSTERVTLGPSNAVLCTLQNTQSTAYGWWVCGDCFRLLFPKKPTQLAQTTYYGEVSILNRKGSWVHLPGVSLKRGQRVRISVLDTHRL